MRHPHYSLPEKEDLEGDTPGLKQEKKRLLAKNNSVMKSDRCNLHAEVTKVARALGAVLRNCRFCFGYEHLVS